MSVSGFTPQFSDLPVSLPIFPLTGALLLPGGTLPLNIFEPRYLEMVNAALESGNRMIGMIQPKAQGAHELYRTGCAGRITDFSETPDGRYLISLQGVCRFDVGLELEASTAFRQVQPEWRAYEADLQPQTCLGLNREELEQGLRAYFQIEGLSCEWERIEEISDGELITCLSMICPFDPKEKQALLEATCCKGRAELFMNLLDFALRSAPARDSQAEH